MRKQMVGVLIMSLIASSLLCSNEGLTHRRSLSAPVVLQRLREEKYAKFFGNVPKKKLSGEDIFEKEELHCLAYVGAAALFALDKLVLLSLL